MNDLQRPRVNSLCTKTPPKKPPRRSTISTFSSWPSLPKEVNKPVKKRLVRTPSQLYHYIKYPEEAKYQKLNIRGPEFIVRSKDPPIKIKLPDCVSKKEKTTKKVTVMLLNGQQVEVLCDPSTAKISSVFKAISQMLPCDVHHLLGLAKLIRGEFHFLPPKLKISKVAPKDWKNSKSSEDLFSSVRLTLFIHFICYPDLDAMYLMDEDTLNLVYLQLRHDILEGRVFLPYILMMSLASLALQAEFGAVDFKDFDYFLLEHFLPQNFIDVCGRSADELSHQLFSLHHSIQMPPSMAKSVFVSKYKESLCYGVRFFHSYLDYPEKRVWLAVGFKGFRVLHESPSLDSLRRSTLILWKDVEKCSCSSLKLNLTYKNFGKITRSEFCLKERSRFALHLIEMYKFFIKNPDMLKVGASKSYSVSQRSRPHSLLSSVEEMDPLPEKEILKDDWLLCLEGSKLQSKITDCKEHHYTSSINRSHLSLSECVSENNTKLSTPLIQNTSQSVHNSGCSNNKSNSYLCPLKECNLSTDNVTKIKCLFCGRHDNEYPINNSILNPADSSVICDKLSDFSLSDSHVVKEDHSINRLLGSGSDDAFNLDIDKHKKSDDGSSLDNHSFKSSCIAEDPKTSQDSLNSSCNATPFSTPKKTFSGVRMGTKVTSARLQKQRVRLLDSPGDPVLERTSPFAPIVIEPSESDQPSHLNNSASDSLLTRFIGATDDSLERRLVNVKLTKEEGSLGLCLGQGNDGGLYITSISLGGPAYEEGTLKSGDRLVGINGLSVENVSYNRAVSLLKSFSNSVFLLVSQPYRTSIFVPNEASTEEKKIGKDSIIDKNHVTVISIGSEEALRKECSEKTPP